MENIQIVILAAGQGKRMNADIPKVLVPFHGKPMIDYVIDAAAHSGISAKPILVVGYGKELVMQHLGDKASYATQEELLGTGHAVKTAYDLIPESADHVLVLFGDQPAITGAMISNLAKTHTSSNKPVTMATVTVPSFDGWYNVFYSSFSRIVRDGDGTILRSVEFKDATEEEKKIKELNPCYFCFKKDWLFEKLDLIRNENAQGEYYLTDLVKYAAEGDGPSTILRTGIASVSISPEEALGVNTIEQLKELEEIIKPRE